MQFITTSNYTNRTSILNSRAAYRESYDKQVREPQFYNLNILSSNEYWGYRNYQNMYLEN